MRAITSQVALLAASVLAVLVLVFAVYLPNLRHENHVAAAEGQLAAAAADMERHLALGAQEAAQYLAGIPNIIGSAGGGEPPDSADTLHILRTVRDLIGADIVYVMDDSGTVVASTRYNGNESTLTGKNYAFRPYFTRALAGVGNTYAALGVTTKQRGLYFGEPIREPGHDTPVGVIVVKMGLAEVDRILSHLESSACLLSPEGIVFASSRKAWLFGSALPLSDGAREALRSSRQFADVPLDPIGVDLSRETVLLDGLVCVPLIAECSIEGWRLVSCIYPSSAYPLTRSQEAIVLFLLGALLLLLVTGIVIAINTFLRRQAEARYREVVENMSEAIIVLQNEKIVFHNRRAREMTGYTASDLSTMRGEELMAPDERDHVGRYYRSVLNRDESRPEHYEGRLMRADGAILFVLVSGVCIQWLGRSAILAFVVDVSKQKRLQERLADSTRMEAIGQLAGGIAHDFNNLLTAMLGYAEILGDQLPKGDERREIARAIETAAQRAAELTRQLLGFARRGRHRSEPTDMHGLIKETAEFLSRTLGKHITIETRLEAAHSTVIGDRPQLRQIIENLAINARDAMPDGGVLTIATEDAATFTSSAATASTARPSCLKIEVSDTGSGIDPAYLGRIFEPFFTRKKNGKGTGLGLAMVYGIVANHGGTITVASEKGEGSTFTMLLPCTDGQEVEKRRASGESALANKSLAGCRIMVVDDEVAVADMTASILAKRGGRVDVFNDSRDAVEHYRKCGEDIDLVVQDMEMPGMDGGECYRMLGRINPEVRVLLVTGYGLNEKAQGLLDEGMLGFLQKPYTGEELFRAVGDVLSQ
jgi:PAS domain S-box-containing protein